MSLTLKSFAHMTRRAALEIINHELAVSDMEDLDEKSALHLIRSVLPTPTAPGMVTDTLQLTPNLAALFLRRLGPNRWPSPGHVQALARSITAGEWHLHHQGLGFSEAYELLDGQHRCRAVITAGQAIPVRVTWNGTEADLTMADHSLRPKRPSDGLASYDPAHLGPQGTNPQPIARALVLLMNYRAEATEAKTVWYSHVQSEEALQALYDEMADFVLPWVESAKDVSKVAKLTMPHVLFVLAEAAHQGWPKRVLTDFAQGLVTGAGLDAGDPRLVLRNWAIARPRGHRGTNEVVRADCARIIRALMAFAEGRSLKRSPMGSRSDESFPRIPAWSKVGKENPSKRGKS